MPIARGSLSVCVLLVGLGAASLGLVGCGDDGSTGGGGQGGGEGGAPANGPTFYKDVLPILQRSCLKCHTEGRIAGFSLGTYEDAKSQAGVMAAVTESGLMPPWHAIETDDCQPPQPFVGDPRLPAEEVALLRAWDEAGAPEGDPNDAPDTGTPPDLDVTDPDLELTPNEASIVEGENDQFVCVVYDPALTGEQFIDAIHIVPGNQKVAHHALLFRVERDNLADASAERFDCFGAPQGDLIHAWAPGGTPLQLPEDVGMPIDESHVIVVQMHYHPTGTTTEEDSSTVQIHFTEEEPGWEFQIALPGNESSAPGLLPNANDRNETPEFRIPAGVTDHVEQMVIEVPAVPIELPILMVATHMHYVGVDARFWIERPTPGAGEAESECFVQTPAWDFNWQRGYMYDAPIASLPTASAGDLLKLECRYNNSMSNRFVREALEAEGLSAPMDVTLGEETLDEMCLGVIGFLVPRL